MSANALNEVIHDLAHLLEVRARRHPERTAFTFQFDGGTETALTYRDLEKSAFNIAANLQVYCKPGDRAMLTFPPGLDFIKAFFGCLYAGVIPVPTSYPKPRRPMSRLESIYKDADPAAILSNAQVIEQSIDARERYATARWIAIETLDAGSAPDFKRAAVSPADLCWLQYTSGSTTEPKGVMISHDNVLDNLERIRRGFQLSPADESTDDVPTGVFWLPAYHDMGLIGGILMPLYVGGHSLLMAPTSFLQQPIRWLRAIHDYRAQVSGAPNFAYELCAKRIAPEQRAELRLDSWRVAFCGAEPVRAATLSAFADTFAESGFDAVSFYPCYGLAESTLLAAGGEGPASPTIVRVSRDSLRRNVLEPAADSEANVELVACGRPTTDGECRIVEPQTGAALSAGQVGEIWLNGGSVARGYWRRPVETAEKFEARMVGDARTWLRTGDLGVLHDGRLYVTGRLSDRIIVRGRNYYPQNLEATATSAHLAIRSDVAAAFSIVDGGEEQVVVALELQRTEREPDFEAITRAVRARLIADEEIDPSTIVFVRCGNLPLTTSGKIRRNSAREAFQKRSWSELHRWDRAALSAFSDAVLDPAAERLLHESCSRRGKSVSLRDRERFAERIEAWLVGWLAARLDLSTEQTDPRRPFAEYGLDSLASVELAEAVQRCLEIRPSPVAAWDHPTPAKLARFLADEVCGPAINDVEHATAMSASTFDKSPVKPPPLLLATTPDDIDRLLAEVEGMSDSEAEQAMRGISETRN